MAPGLGADPGETAGGLFGRSRDAVGMWLWEATAEEFVARATAVLLRFVHPLTARALPYCLGFPFGRSLFAPSALGLHEAARLDLEDIGRLLGVCDAGDAPAAQPGVRRIAGVRITGGEAGGAGHTPADLSRRQTSRSTPPSAPPSTTGTGRPACWRRPAPARRRRW